MPRLPLLYHVSPCPREPRDIRGEVRAVLRRRDHAAPVRMLRTLSFAGTRCAQSDCPEIQACFEARLEKQRDALCILLLACRDCTHERFVSLLRNYYWNHNYDTLWAYLKFDAPEDIRGALLPLVKYVNELALCV
jgi:hypothetical protein